MIEKSLKLVSRAFLRQARSIMSSQQLKPVAEETGIHQMGGIPKNPFDLFKSWHSEQTGNHISANALCLSTATREGRVSSRNLILRRLDDDGFVIMTDKRSKKCGELTENPYAAMSFLWVKEDDGIIHSRQVRAEGPVQCLPAEDWTEIYEREPLFCKIRSYVCHQGQDCDWGAMKDHHDSLLSQWLKGEVQLDRPDHVVAYKLQPTMIEFYETCGPRIADRVTYLKQKSDDWFCKRIAA